MDNEPETINFTFDIGEVSFDRLASDTVFDEFKALIEDFREAFDKFIKVIDSKCPEASYEIIDRNVLHLSDDVAESAHHFYQCEFKISNVSPERNQEMKDIWDNYFKELQERAKKFDNDRKQALIETSNRVKDELGMSFS